MPEPGPGTRPAEHGDERHGDAADTQGFGEAQGVVRRGAARGQEQRGEPDEREECAAPLRTADPAARGAGPERDGCDECERAERLDQGERSVLQRGDVQQCPAGVQADRRPPGSAAQQAQRSGGGVGQAGEPGLRDRGGRVGTGGDEGERDGCECGVHRRAPERA